MASGPRSFNFLTFVLVLGFAAGGYWVWKFFPVYFTAWQVDHVLSDGAAKTYKIHQLHEPAQSQSKQELVDDLRRQIVALGVTDPELAVDIDIQDDKARVSCDYTVVVQHIIKDKLTVLTLHRKAAGDLKRVNWDN